MLFTTLFKNDTETLYKYISFIFVNISSKNFIWMMRTFWSSPKTVKISTKDQRSVNKFYGRKKEVIYSIFTKMTAYCPGFIFENLAFKLIGPKTIQWIVFGSYPDIPYNFIILLNFQRIFFTVLIFISDLIMDNFFRHKSHENPYRYGQGSDTMITVNKRQASTESNLSIIWSL